MPSARASTSSCAAISPVVSARAEMAGNSPMASATVTMGNRYIDSQLSEMARSSRVAGRALIAASGLYLAWCRFLQEQRDDEADHEAAGREIQRALQAVFATGDPARDDGADAAANELAREDHEAGHRGQHARRRGLRGDGTREDRQCREIEQRGEEQQDPQRGGVLGP